MNYPIELSTDVIRVFCHRWQITHFALFGSVLRDDFGPNSDIDILVTFANKATWTLFDHVKMQGELQNILGRKVDLVSKRAIESSHNQLRRQAILESAQVVYALT